MRHCGKTAFSRNKMVKTFIKNTVTVGKLKFIILTEYILGDVAVSWSCLSRLRENNETDKLLI